MRVLSLCSGIGGLELAVGGDVVAVSEIERDPADLLGQQFGAVPNLGDWTEVDSIDEWAPDAITGGLPCQPVSSAGRRKGEADERWLFDDFLELLARSTSRPVVFFENVADIRSPEFTGAMSRWRQGMAALGYRLTEGVFAASDAGAPHRRKRWFCVAAHRDEPLPDLTHLDPDGPVPNDHKLLPTPIGQLERGVGFKKGDLTRMLLPTHRSSVGGPRATTAQHEGGADLAAALLPTVTAREAKGPTGAGFNEHGRSSLSNTLLPTATAADAERTNSGYTTSLGGVLLPTATGQDSHGAANRWTLAGTLVGGPPSHPSDGYVDGDGRIARDGWSIFQPAIDHWCPQMGRDPTVQVQALSDKGELLRLISAEFVEWFMGFPDAWTVGRIDQRPALKALGNAVVPAQARHAFGELLFPRQQSLFDE